jgi:hypothetical protein
MSLEHLQTVLRPKVEGSINLDKLFQDNSLNFFLFFSFVTCVVARQARQPTPPPICSWQALQNSEDDADSGPLS